MNPEIKSLWVAALRSGEYGQTDGQLRRTYNNGDPAEYCCLGVLCDLYSKEKDIPWNDETDHFLGSGSFPPHAVAEWAGMGQGEWIGTFGDLDGDNADVVTMNDAGKNTFSEIADVIERLG